MEREADKKRRSSCLLVFLLAVAGCGGGSPLLHPAKSLPTGEVRAAVGFSENIAMGGASDAIQAALVLNNVDPNASTPTGSKDPSFARGALAEASIAPGIAPFVGARVGIGWEAEGGVAYTGRGARIDMRKSITFGHVSLSAGVGGTGLFYGHQNGGDLYNVNLGQLRGYGADVPLLVGWASDGDLYRAWIGPRFGFEHAMIEQASSENKTQTLEGNTISLSATRFWGGGVVGFAVGFRHVHVALELDVAYQHVEGSYNSVQATLDGLTLAPASAIWLTF
jgi:hypothetical protein